MTSLVRLVVLTSWIYDYLKVHNLKVNNKRQDDTLSVHVSIVHSKVVIGFCDKV